jgi:hypothetical protein
MPQKRYFRKGGCRESGTCGEGDAAKRGLAAETMTPGRHRLPVQVTPVRLR